MPDRIIRDELLTSERYWAVGIEAQQLFVHLLLCADSLGRFSGKNFTLRMACYPGHARNPDLIEAFLTALHDADLIRLYMADGERFLFIPRYRQRLRYLRSKYPPPPPEINDIKDLPEEKSDSGPSQVRLKTAEVKRREAVPLPKRTRKPPEPKPSGTPTWIAYRAAYLARYHVEPVRNQAINAMLSRLCTRIAASAAPHVAAYYVSTQDRIYTQAKHPITLLLRDAEGLHTAWAQSISHATAPDSTSHSKP